MAESRHVQPEVTYNKVSRITGTYQEVESALRIGMINKVLTDIQTNACTDGTAECGPNSVCISLEEPDEYEVRQTYHLLNITKLANIPFSVNVKTDSPLMTMRGASDVSMWTNAVAIISVIHTLIV